MLFGGSASPLCFLAMLYAGVIVGVVSEIESFILKLTKNAALISTILDVLVVLFGGFAFIITINSTCFGYFRVYMLVAFLFGIYLEKTTIGFLVAFLCKFVYNNIIKLIALMRRKACDSRKTKDNS